MCNSYCWGFIDYKHETNQQNKKIHQNPEKKQQLHMLLAQLQCQKSNF